MLQLAYKTILKRCFMKNVTYFLYYPEILFQCIYIYKLSLLYKKFTSNIDESLANSLFLNLRKFQFC